MKISRHDAFLRGEDTKALRILGAVKSREQERDTVDVPGMSHLKNKMFQLTGIPVCKHNPTQVACLKLGRAYEVKGEFDEPVCVLVPCGDDTVAIFTFRNGVALRG